MKGWQLTDSTMARMKGWRLTASTIARMKGWQATNSLNHGTVERLATKRHGLTRFGNRHQEPRHAEQA
jgi:hypothetical protein